MQTTVAWQGQAAFAVTTGSGHTFTVDGPPEIGGVNAGPRPMELMLASVGSCSAVDVVHILRKARQNVSGVTVAVDGTRAATDPKVFTHIHLLFTIRGKALNEKQVERAVALSADKYCSASLTLKGKVEITHSFILSEDPA